MQTKITELFGIQHPIIQGGMVWCSGWRLASAVSEAGGLGLLGAGSMHPDTLRYHIQQCKQATRKPFGVNVPLLYPEIERIMHIIMEENVPIVFTSAGSPKTWTSTLQSKGIKVAHVVSNPLFAQKSEQAGVDALVAEGFEAGGHNGREELTTFCLIPMVRAVTQLPLIAAGGVHSRASYRAALVLGADGVQIGTRFALSEESSAHPEFKSFCRNLQPGQTQLMLKRITPTRLAENPFAKQVQEAERAGADEMQLSALLGKGRAKKGIFEGNLIEGELEIGQVAGSSKRAETVADIFADLI